MQYEMNAQWVHVCFIPVYSRGSGKFIVIVWQGEQTFLCIMGIKNVIFQAVGLVIENLDGHAWQNTTVEKRTHFTWHMYCYIEQLPNAIV